MNSGIESEIALTASGQAEARVLVAGVGNIFLRDDGFGPEVIRRLVTNAAPLAAGLQIVDYGIRGMHLAYDLLGGVDMLVLVDTVPRAAGGTSNGFAARSPGSIRVMRVRAEDLDASAGLDAHGMNPTAVLGQLRTLGGELPLTYVVGCVPADLSDGIGLSDPVSAALPEAIAVVGLLLTLHDSTKHP